MFLLLPCLWWIKIINNKPNHRRSMRRPTAGRRWRRGHRERPVGRRWRPGEVAVEVDEDRERTGVERRVRWAASCAGPWSDGFETTPATHGQEPLRDVLSVECYHVIRSQSTAAYTTGLWRLLLSRYFRSIISRNIGWLHRVISTDMLWVFEADHAVIINLKMLKHTRWNSNNVEFLTKFTFGFQNI